MKYFLIIFTLLLLPAAAFAQEFVALTDIPAFENAQTADGLAGIFNYLYVIAVGAAAVIAVLQFVRAGIMYAVMDTGVVEKREARHLMTMSILGLILVLSPAIVFGIINPDILSLRIGTTLGPGSGNGAGDGQNAGGAGDEEDEENEEEGEYLTLQMPAGGAYTFIVAGYDPVNQSVYNVRYYGHADPAICEQTRSAYAAQLEEVRAQYPESEGTTSVWYYSCDLLSGQVSIQMPVGATVNAQPI